MTYFTGTNGNLEIDGQRAARVANWQLSANTALLPVTSLGDTDAVVTAGITSTTGTCQLFYYEALPGETERNDASYLLSTILQACINPDDPGKANERSAVTFKLIIKDGTTEGKRVAVNAYIQSASIGSVVGAISSAQIVFQSIGAPTEVAI